MNEETPSFIQIFLAEIKGGLKGGFTDYREKAHYGRPVDYSNPCSNSV